MNLRASLPYRSVRGAAPAPRGGERFFSLDMWLGAAACTALLSALGFGSKAVIVFLAAPAILVLRHPKASGQALLHGWFFFLYPAVALASVAWSHAPDLSLRGAAQLILTVALTLIIAKHLTGRQFVFAVFVCCAVNTVFCLLFPYKHYGPEGVALVGIMGSKNQMSFLAGLLGLSALAVLVNRQFPPWLRLTCLACFLGSPILVIEAKSAGGLVGFLLGTGLVLGLTIFSRLTKATRAVLIIFALVVTVPVALNLSSAKEVSDEIIVNGLHKDTTLTGRTYLWSRAEAIIAQNPVLGQGYHSFWVQGQADAEGLWSYFGIGNRMGFNFHNIYIDNMVTLGVVGTSALILTIVGISLGGLIQSLILPTETSAFFVAYIVTNIARTGTETNLFGEFALYMVIFIAAGVYCWRALTYGKPAASSIPTAHSGVLNDRKTRVLTRPGADGVLRPTRRG